MAIDWAAVWAFLWPILREALIALLIALLSLLGYDAKVAQVRHKVLVKALLKNAKGER